MASEELRFIASYDDVIRFCGTDQALAARFMTNFAESQGRVATFDPVMAAASNPEVLSDKKADIWRKSKRKVGAFEPSKFTKLFIERMKGHLADPTNETGESVPPMARSGFDAYAYLMAYESEIMGLYGKRDELSALQKAAMHYVEVGSEPKELDYVKYIASYDDLVLGTLSSNTQQMAWEEFVPAIGKMHYESGGRAEVLSGVRPVSDFFDGVKYVATYAAVQDAFKADDGSIDETKAAIAYIAFGASQGLVRNGFNHNVFLANYPELIEEDIYTNGEVSPVKVAKIWLERVKESEGAIDLSRFDVIDFKETACLDDDVDAFRAYVDLKVGEYTKLLKRRSKLFYRVTKDMCAMPKLSAPKWKPRKSKAPIPAPEPVPESAE